METPESKPPFEPTAESREDSSAQPKASEPAIEGGGAAVTPELYATPPPAPVDPLAKYPEDLRTPWGWLDLLLLLFIGFISLIVAGQVAASVVTWFFQTTFAGIEKIPNAKAAFAVISQVVVSAVVMLYLWFAARVRFQMPFAKALAWRKLEIPGMGRGQAHFVCLLGGAVLAIFVGIASAALRPDVPLPIEEMFRSRQSVYMIMVVGILVAPLVEEVIFRGLLYPVLARSWGVRAGVLVTGASFGLMHAAQLWGGWGQIALLTIVGIVFTFVRARTGTVLAPYLLHLGYNTLLFAAFFAATGGLKNLPGK